MAGGRLTGASEAARGLVGPWGRVAVRQSHPGLGRLPLAWAALRTAEAGRPYLRLDVDPMRSVCAPSTSAPGFVAVGMSTSARWPAVLYERRVRDD